MAEMAKGDQVVFCRGALLATEFDVMNLQA